MAARRVRVAEGRAKSDLRRLLWLAAAATLIGGFIWLLTSPLLSVREIITYGVNQADVESVLTDMGVVEGRPLVAIRSSRVADRIAEDPWVADASITLVFPDLVEVSVVERRSAAWINVGSAWAHVASDGIVVDYAAAPPADAPTVRWAAADPGIGRPLEDVIARQSVEFIGALPPELVRGVEIREDAGEVWATVDGRTVRLGTPGDMRAKAAAVAAVIGLSDSGVIDVIAPSRPAIWAGSPPETGESNPEGEVNGEG